jgi:hypothetical protein
VDEGSSATIPRTAWNLGGAMTELIQLPFQRLPVGPIRLAFLPFLVGEGIRQCGDAAGGNQTQSRIRVLIPMAPARKTVTVGHRNVLRERYILSAAGAWHGCRRMGREGYGTAATSATRKPIKSLCVSGGFR